MAAKVSLSVFIGVFLTLTSLNAQLPDLNPMPQGFTCEGILIIEKFKDKTTIYGYEQAIKKRFKDYKGKYVLATEDDIKTDSLYQDKKTYKFFLRVKSDQEFEVAHGKTRYAGKLRTFYLEDREAGKTYNTFRQMRAGNETLETMVNTLNASCK